MLNHEQKNELLRIARQTVEEYVKKSAIPEFSAADEELNKPGGAFVTVRKNGELRGCIGRILADGAPLWQVVRDMALAACSEDSRFPPVSAGELPEIKYEISVLSAPKRIGDWRQIQLGRHGVIVKRGFRSAVFLPQVADETGWSREEFLGELCARKAGLPRESYKEKDAILEVFTAEVFGDKE